MDNCRRIERMLRELHSGPPLGFLEDLFALREFALKQLASARKAVVEIAEDELAL